MKSCGQSPQKYMVNPPQHIYRNSRNTPQRVCANQRLRHHHGSAKISGKYATEHATAHTTKKIRENLCLIPQIRVPSTSRSSTSRSEKILLNPCLIPKIRVPTPLNPSKSRFKILLSPYPGTSRINHQPSTLDPNDHWTLALADGLTKPFSR